MLRFFDIFFASVGLVILSPVMVVTLLMVALDGHCPLFFQQRIGQSKLPFNLVKFRTMKVGTVSLATHLVDKKNITKIGRLLRRTKVDELPQLWNVLCGDMSLVGPRPGLFNQQDLVQARSLSGVYDVRPGITGLAQINGIDMSKPELLAQTDAKMISEFSTLNYFKLIFLTLVGNVSSRVLRD